MKRLMIGLVGALALTACGKKAEHAEATKTADVGAAKPAAAAVPPMRKVGLWEQKMSMADMTQVSRICIDEAVNQKLSLWGQQADKDMCSEQQVTPKPGGGWTFRSTCDMGSGGKVVSQGDATGDFAGHYTVKVKSTTTGASAPQMNGEHDMTLDATWKGPCPADFKPGDMALENGPKFNLLALNAK